MELTEDQRENLQKIKKDFDLESGLANFFSRTEATNIALTEGLFDPVEVLEKTLAFTTDIYTIHPLIRRIKEMSLTLDQIDRLDGVEQAYKNSLGVKEIFDACFTEFYNYEPPEKNLYVYLIKVYVERKLPLLELLKRYSLSARKIFDAIVRLNIDLTDDQKKELEIWRARYQN
jgi:hypothetical protein